MGDPVEIDPDVVLAAREYLNLQPGFRILTGDSRRVLRDRNDFKFVPFSF